MGRILSPTGLGFAVAATILSIPAAGSADLAPVGVYEWGAPELVIDRPTVVGGLAWDDPACAGDWDFQQFAPNHVRVVYTSLCDGVNDHIARFDLRIAVAGIPEGDWAPGHARLWIRGEIQGGGFFNQILTGSGVGTPIGGPTEIVFTGSGDFQLITSQREPPPFGFVLEVGGRTWEKGQTWAHEVRVDQIGIVTAPDVDSPVPVVFGTSWDGHSLQQILDEEYGTGAIDARHGYEGFLPGDGDPAYWEDLGFDTVLVREIAGFDDTNVLGWYVEDLGGPPVIDGLDDGVVFDGASGSGAETLVAFPNGAQRFGFYLQPNGPDSSHNAPAPETFFTNRRYHDLGPDGAGPHHPPWDGDVQCLIFDVSHLRGGVPTWVLAWEDLDSGADLSSVWDVRRTDNDFNDLVVEVSAFSPVRVEKEAWSTIKGRYRD